MKVGLSLSRCMRDIFEGKVDIKDVLVIIARTDIDPYNDDHWEQIWDGYLYGGFSNKEWEGLEEYEQDMRELLIDLYGYGKLHQPRQFNAHPARMPYYWLDCSVPLDEMSHTVKKAYDKYKMLEGLS
jgi:hypothetical protein